MGAFTETVRDARLHRRREGALGRSGAFQQFKDALSDHPDERERWLAFRDERLHRMTRAWLDEHDISATTASPPGGEVGAEEYRVAVDARARLAPMAL
jgi:hypothetical protein